MSDAAADFLDTLAQTILKLYVMQPLLDSLFGKQGSAGGGLLGGVLGNLFSDPLAVPVVTPSLFANGGIVRGPGGPKSDSVPAYVSPGEFVVNAAATAKNRGLLEAINNGIVGFANGGYVGLPSPPVPTMGEYAHRDVSVLQQFDLRGAMVDKDVWATVNQIASAHATSAGKQAISTALKPHVLGPAMDKAKGARGAKAF
jgi:hypothetical protein